MAFQQGCVDVFYPLWLHRAISFFSSFTSCRSNTVHWCPTSQVHTSSRESGRNEKGLQCQRVKFHSYSPQSHILYMLTNLCGQEPNRISYKQHIIYLNDYLVLIWINFQCPCSFVYPYVPLLSATYSRFLKMYFLLPES